MLEVFKSKKYKKNIKKYRGKINVINELNKILELLKNQKPIPKKYYDHQLKGEYEPIRELHLKPDDLLLYYIITEDNLLTLVNIGSHSDIFG